ncbi:Flp family type IVb pilin [Nocardioides sp. SOB44]|uniref:Flp family type IVb pilin n=1 Tax=Nocardioides cremeus TaxID=3058044 RepID=A0ABT8TT96_9ACTN|nr:Flp family type IVb pilin [Nocardioides cremeus]MDO3397177.1 Flp family type IVb pilin [Nocardioides cremeus]
MIEKLQLMTLVFIGDLKEKRSERGATAVEYGLMVSLIALAIIGVVTILGTTLAGEFQTVVDAL